MRGARGGHTVLGLSVGWWRRCRAWQVGKVSRTPLPQCGSIRGRLWVHPALTTAVGRLWGWRTFASDKAVGPAGRLVLQPICLNWIFLWFAFMGNGFGVLFLNFKLSGEGI